ncbi:MAG TPA: DUF4249 domain-containing protein [Puia sp.]|nr:DUF4249 domain-containing protein [Puia sp.]
MKWIWLCFVIMLVSDCKQVYNAPVKSPSTGYLVVEGFISVGSTPTSITLTRTTKLVDSVDIIYENNATVTIEDSINNSYSFHSNGNGVYVADQTNLSNNQKYRLHILTSDGKEYASDFVQAKSTPPIDSVYWTRESGGVQIYVSTHDPQNNSRYYLWNYDETWEFHSPFQSSLMYIKDATNNITALAYRNANQTYDTTIYKCWRYASSTNILIASSEKLSSDLIDRQPVLFIPATAQEISVLFSINVKQHVVSKDAYQFYQLMKNNTEELGTIFDAQPSHPSGNIHCISNPSEIVIGYVDVTSEESSRLFISRNDVGDWFYDSGCIFTIIKNDVDSMNAVGKATIPIIPTEVNRATEAIIHFSAASPVCVDCTLTGTNMKPSFWP